MDPINWGRSAAKKRVNREYYQSVKWCLLDIKEDSEQELKLIPNIGHYKQHQRRAETQPSID